MPTNLVSPIAAIAAAIALVGCVDSAIAEDGVVRHCLAGQAADPQRFNGDAAACECTANKLRGLLTAEHYAVFAGYWGTATDIEASLPGLRGPEMTARVLKALAFARNESPSVVFQLLSESRSVTTYAYRLCGVYPSR